MKKAAIHHIVTLPLGYFSQNASGRLRKIIDDNAGLTEDFLAHQLPDLTGAVVMPVAVLVLIFIFDWRLGICCLVPMGISVFFLKQMMGGDNAHFMEGYMTALENMNKEAVEDIRGIPVVKVFQQTVYSFKNFHAAIEEYEKYASGYALKCRIPMTGFNVALNSTFILLIPVAGMILGAMTGQAAYQNILLDFLFYSLFAPICTTMMNRIMFASEQLMAAKSAVTRIEEILNEQPLPDGRRMQEPEDASVAFEKVSFCYPGTDVKALDEITFEVPAGKTVALVGASGSGKSTAAKLIPRFFDVCDGKVLVGGVDVKDISKSVLMDQIAFVFQNTRLFKDTLLENIRAARPEATREEVMQALEAAQCKEIVERLPEGLDTIVGNGGTYLSGGENQRIALAEKLRTLPLRFFQKRNLSDLTNTIMGDCAGFEHAFSHTVPQFWGSVISTLLVCVALLIYDWRMGLALVWVVPVAFAIVFLSRCVQEKRAQKHINAKLELADGIQECLETVPDIRACNQEESYLKKLDKKMDTAEKSQIASEMLTASLVTCGQMFLRLGLATVIVVGNMLMIHGQTSLFSYILFLIAASRLYDPLSGAMTNMAELFSVDLQVKRLKEIQEYKEEKKQTSYHTDGYDLKFDHVKFAYEPGKPVLKDVTFTAKQGQVTALVGPSGGGKSTVANLAAGFYDVDSGTISLGGTDIAPIDSVAMMKDFSVVFQNVVLFNNTIMENIRVGRKNASDQEVIEAAKAARCHEFIEKLPEKYQTVIGENGSTLSGGEGQRLSIARALLKDAPVILLDEATASLDVDNETEIQEAISRLVKGKTVLVIAHRMRTVERADQIIVLADGVVAESGTHEKLMEKDGLYARLVKLQNASAEWKLNTREK